MKKILLTTAAIAALSSTAFAESDSFFLRLDAGIAFTQKYEVLKNTAKNKANATLDLGFGYNVMDNARVELVYNHPFFTQRETNKAKDKVTPTVHALFVRGAYDVVDLGMVKPYVAVGLGMSQTQSKVIQLQANLGDGATADAEYKAKSKYNFAWTAGAGLAFEVSEGVTVDVAYSYRDYGKTKLAQDTNKKDIENTSFSLRSHNATVGVRFDI